MLGLGAGASSTIFAPRSWAVCKAEAAVEELRASLHQLHFWSPPPDEVGLWQPFTSLLNPKPYVNLKP